MKSLRVLAIFLLLAVLTGCGRHKVPQEMIDARERLQDFLKMVSQEPPSVGACRRAGYERGINMVDRAIAEKRTIEVPQLLYAMIGREKNQVLLEFFFLGSGFSANGLRFKMDGKPVGDVIPTGRWAWDSDNQRLWRGNATRDLRYLIKPISIQLFTTIRTTTSKFRRRC